MAAFESAGLESAVATPQVSVPPRQVTRRSKFSRRWTIPTFAAAAAALMAVVLTSSADRPEAERVVYVAERTTSAPVRVVNPPHVLTPFAMGPGYLGDDLDAQRVWAAELAQGIQPVKTSVYSALQTIWRTLPASEIARVIL